MDPAATAAARDDVGPPRAGVRATARSALLFAVVALLLLWPALASGDRLGGKDWNAFLGQAQAESETLLRWGEFPSWNPWRRGGQVAFAQPESMLLTPVTPLVLALGAPLAFKLVLVPLFVVCGLGLVALARDLGLRGAAAQLPGLAFVCASPLALYVNGGLPNWLVGMACLPWLLLASRRAATSRRWLVGGALLFALLLFAGSVHHFVFFPLVLAIEAAARALRERSARPLVASAAMGIAGVASSLVRLVPLLELFSEFPRRLDASGRFMPIGEMARSLLLPHPAAIEEGLHVSLQGGSVLYWVDCGAFVGPVVALLALLAVARQWRRAWPFAAVALAFAWLAAGSSVQPSAWDALHQLPVYASMQAPERFMGYVAFALALLAGFGCESLLHFAARRSPTPAPPRWAAALLLLSVAVPLVWFDAPLAQGAFPVAAPSDVAPTTLASPHPRPPPPAFVQARFDGVPAQWGGPLYEAVLRNRGNVSGQSDVPSLAATKAVGDLDYRGEAWLAGGHGRVAASFTPNTIAVEATLDADDVVVINQNFFPGWRDTNSGRSCEPREGLIALPLTKGEHRIALEFAPRSLPIGVLLTALTLVVLTAWRWRLRREASRASPSGGASPGAAVSLPSPLPFSSRHDLLALLLLSLLVGGVFAWHATRAPAGAVPPPRPWRDDALLVEADGDLQALQRAVDAAPVGAILRLAPENFGDVVLRRGVTLVADPPGAARIASLRVEGLPAGETVVVLDVAMRAVVPVEQRGPEEPVGWTFEQCAGSIIVQGHSGSRRENGEVVANCARRMIVRRCPQVVLFDQPIAVIEAEESRLQLTRAVMNGASTGDHPALSATRSAIVLQSAVVAREQQLRAMLAESSTLRVSGLDPARVDASCDATSSFADLDARGFSLQINQRYGRGRASPSPLRGQSVLLHLRGAPRAKGTLIVARDVDFVSLKGKNLGQLRAPKFDGREILFPFELDDSGFQQIPVVPAPDDSHPGDGWFFQAFVVDDRDGAGLLYTVMDGGLLDPTPAPR